MLAMCNLLLYAVAHPQFLAPLLLNLAIVKGKGKGALGSGRATGGEPGKYSTLLLCIYNANIGICDR